MNASTLAPLMSAFQFQQHESVRRYLDGDRSILERVHLGRGKFGGAAQLPDLCLGCITRGSHSLVRLMHVPMLGIDSRYHYLGRTRLAEGQFYILVRADSSRRGEVPSRNHQGAVSAAGGQNGIRGRVRSKRQALVSELVEKPERVVGGLRNSSRRDQSKAAVERLLHHTLLLKYIGERPIRHLVDQPVALTDGVGHPRTHVCRVGH